jgi:uncharacterized protein
MIKWLLVIGVVVIIYVLFIKKRPAITKKQDEKDTKKQSNEMIECASCGIYCAIDDTILSANKYYCSDECVSKA